MMTAAERYHFDVFGYLVLENVVPEQVLSQLDPVVDAWERRSALGPDKNKAKLEGILFEDERFLELTMTKAVLSRVVDMVRLPKLKSTWLDFKAQGGAIGFHANHTPYNPVDAYHWQGEFCANLVTVCYALADVPADGGALEVLPGSHKANYPLPEAEAAAAMRIRLPLKRGSALIFSHDMNHGSCNSLPYVRRCYFTSFSTGSSAHTQGESDMYEALFNKAPTGSWCKYLLRRPKGDRDSYPQPSWPVAEDPYFNDKVSA